MRRLLRCWAAVCGVLLWQVGPACAQFYQQRSGAAPAAAPSVRHISVPQFGQQQRQAFSQLQTTRPPATQAAPPNAPAASLAPHHEHHSHHASHHNNLGYWGGYPIVWGGVYSPLFAPVYPAVNWGPNFDFVQPPLVQPAVAPAPQGAVPPIDPGPRGKPRVTNVEQKAKAGKFIAFGDANFANQKYMAAVDRYKTASQVAPDLPETYLRQGHALLALGQYDNAVKAFKRGLRIRNDWPDPPYSLDQLYARDPLAKTSHTETLAKAVEANPLDTTLLYCLGMQLLFDGQRARAEVFFSRVAELGGNDDRLLDNFLPKPAPAGAAPAAGKIIF